MVSVIKSSTWIRNTNFVLLVATQEPILSGNQGTPIHQVHTLQQWKNSKTVAIIIVIKRWKVEELNSVDMTLLLANSEDLRGNEMLLTHDSIYGAHVNNTEY
jgi:hypothetical protein